MAPLNLFRLSAGRSASQGTIKPSIRLRHFHQTSLYQLPRKDSQNKDSINTDATEYSKSGTDDQVAKQEQVAFDPSQTDPGKQKSKAEEGNEGAGNPLEVSPANTDVSKQKPQQKAEAENPPSEKKQSSYGSPKKGKKF